MKKRPGNLAPTFGRREKKLFLTLASDSADVAARLPAYPAQITKCLRVARSSGCPHPAARASRASSIGAGFVRERASEREEVSRGERDGERTSRERGRAEAEKKLPSPPKELSPGSSAQLLWHAAACSLTRAAFLAAALGRGETGRGGQGGEQVPLPRRAAPPSGLAAAAAEAEAAAAAAANADVSSLSSACLTELKRPLVLKDAGARLDILFFVFET